ncbi:MAG: 2-amino-4-hydroxy-6-hydroxymethyldihydropteridine diphosphokinase [Arenicellales bacterium]|nr:2-amino-4-hydroxy-6-hydroxymethyldihydropteridine diphosphokinase [Arenicellales bacterium]MDP7193285.1 2-amino-4-hydroxy-6-hydroxymethyldihydropteridine diphosphokinase [Arenicellales bacterium]
MRQVAVSIGSNIDREHNVRTAVRALRTRFDGVSCSPVYRSEAVGFDGPHFFNLVAAFMSELSVLELLAGLREIESRQGRARAGNSFHSRPIDIDLLLFGDEVLYGQGLDVPRGEILDHAHVLKPLSVVLPAGRHPISGESYADLWSQVAAKSTALLEEIELSLE